MREIVHKATGAKVDGTHVTYSEFFGDSSETKPIVGMGYGCTFTEVDTGNVYMFSEKTSSWVKEFCLKG